MVVADDGVAAVWVACVKRGESEAGTDAGGCELPPSGGLVVGGGATV